MPRHMASTLTDTRPLLLGVDTSGAWIRAALLAGPRVLARTDIAMARGQGERLFPVLETLLQEAGSDWPALAALGVGIGPGNFTGIRISVAAARGLALGLGVPAIGVSILEACAEGLPRPLWVVEDARRDQIYAQHFNGGDDAPRLLDCADIPAVITGGAVTGSAAALVAGQTGLPVMEPACPLAEGIARVAMRRLDQSHPRPAPLYLRAADAAPPRDPAPALLP